MALFQTMLPRITPYVRVAYNASHIILSFGSSVIIFLAVIAKGNAYGLPSVLVYLAAWLAANVWFSAIEAPLKRVVLVRYAYKLTDKETAKDFTAAEKATGKASGWLMRLLLLATLSLSLLVNVDFSEGLTQQQDSSAEIAQDSSHRSSYDRDVALLNNQLTAARLEDNQRISEAKAKREELILAAKKSKGAEMYRLYRAGNGWAQGELKRAIANATRKGDQLLAQAEAARTAPDLQKQLTTYVTTRSASRDTIATMTAAVISTRQTQYLQTVWRRFGTLSVAVLFVAFVFVQSGKYLVMVKLATNEEEDEDNTPGILSAVKGLSKRLNTYAGAMIQEKTKDRLQFAVATPTVKRQTEYRQPAQTKAQTVLQTEMQTKKRQPKSRLSVVGELTVEHEGKKYTLDEMADKMRKWYSRSKTAKTQTSRDGNGHKYEQMKARLSDHLRFKERSKSVTIEKK
jgi:hypothetical protein